MDAAAAEILGRPLVALRLPLLLPLLYLPLLVLEILGIVSHDDRPKKAETQLPRETHQYVLLVSSTFSQETKTEKTQKTETTSECINNNNTANKRYEERIRSPF